MSLSVPSTVPGSITFKYRQEYSSEQNRQKSLFWWSGVQGVIKKTVNKMVASVLEKYGKDRKKGHVGRLRIP